MEAWLSEPTIETGMLVAKSFLSTQLRISPSAKPVKKKDEFADESYGTFRRIRVELADKVDHVYLFDKA